MKTYLNIDAIPDGSIPSIKLLDGGAYREVLHGTNDTTFTLTPNTFHVWDEIEELNISLGEQTEGIANEYLFQFTSGTNSTALSIAYDVKWNNGEAPTIESDKVYQISILSGLGSVMSWDR